MADTRALYEQVILDHTKKPRNFREMEPCDHRVEGFNPLCGDKFTIYIKMDGDTIADVSFQGVGCAISKASASMMTEALRGKTRDEAKVLFGRFHHMVTAPQDEELDEEALGKLRVFGGVRAYPVRIKCATLPWHTVDSALSGDKENVTTE